MKTRITILTAVLMLFVLSNVNSAQNIKVGGGLTFASEISNIGIHANGIYKIDETWEASPTLTYFLEKDYLSWFTIDVNAHYIFSKNDGLTAYGLAGLNMTFWSFDFETEVPNFGFGGVSLDASGTDIGINIGGGARKEISEKMELVGEIKYVLGGANNFAIKAGVVFSL
ncbi:MAG: outer membrane beta-barrel protein [Melioribacteraceae bacterium]|nr:outer membrane beta-barrel protein [Melioribacteraceae bacterium]